MYNFFQPQNNDLNDLKDDFKTLYSLKDMMDTFGKLGEVLNKVALLRNHIEKEDLNIVLEELNKFHLRYSHINIYLEYREKTIFDVIGTCESILEKYKDAFLEIEIANIINGAN